MDLKSDGFEFVSGGADKVFPLLDKVVDSAKVQNAFNQPVISGEYTVINAAEVSVSMGGGFGSGISPTSEQDKPQCRGGGGGGGGMSLSRPVASIIISANGVSVQPIWDYSKIALTVVTVLGSMFIMMARLSSRKQAPCQSFRKHV